MTRTSTSGLRVCEAIGRRAKQAVSHENTRVDDDPWEISAINSLEVTLRDTDSVKHKIQLAQLRSGRHAFKHAGRRPAENAW